MLKLAQTLIMKYKDLFELTQNIRLNLGNQETKGQKKLFKIYEKLKSHLDAYQALIDEVRLDYASVDDKGNVIVDDKGNYKYTKEELKKFNKAFKELEEKEFDYKPIEVINIEGLAPYWFLEGWVTGVTFEKPQEEEL